MGSINIFNPLSSFLSAAPLKNLSNTKKFLWKKFGNAGIFIFRKWLFDTTSRYHDTDGIEVCIWYLKRPETEKVRPKRVTSAPGL